MRFLPETCVKSGFAVITEVHGDKDIMNEIHGPYNTFMLFSHIRITDTTFTGTLSVRTNSLQWPVNHLASRLKEISVGNHDKKTTLRSLQDT